MTLAPLGKLKLNANRTQFFTVVGGPYNDRPDTMVGVKMAREISRPCDIDIPTRDFSVPDAVVLTAGLEKAVIAMLAGQPIWVGCMGGIGRTGLFLAVLAKAWGIEQPVEYVRAHYSSRAVETVEQYNFVSRFPIPAHVTAKIERFKKWSFLRFWRRNLTNTEAQQKAIKTTVARAIW